MTTIQVPTIYKLTIVGFVKDADMPVAPFSPFHLGPNFIEALGNNQPVTEPRIIKDKLTSLSTSGVDFATVVTTTGDRGTLLVTGIAASDLADGTVTYSITKMGADHNTTAQTETRFTVKTTSAVVESNSANVRVNNARFVVNGSDCASNCVGDDVGPNSEVGNVIHVSATSLSLRVTGSITGPSFVVNNANLVCGVGCSVRVRRCERILRFPADPASSVKSCPNKGSPGFGLSK